MTLKVPFAAASVAQARRSLKKWMREQGIAPEHVDDARVVLSELVANSVRHARPLPDGGLEITWCVEGRELELAVTDGGGQTSPHTVEVSAWSTCGRGLAIVDKLVDKWWVETGLGGCTVHTRLSL